MRAPRFWYRPPEAPGPAARLLTPLARLAAAATARRVARPPDLRAAVPVICIGNINIGGTGKTPAAIALAQRLSERGHSPHVVSRGYGGRLAGPVRVDPGRHDAADTGDEPLLLAAFAPCWVARDRAAGVRAAVAAGADVILLDDGFQNPAVARDGSVVVVDAARGFGNGRVFPAGPLREDVAAGLGRADLLLVVGEPGARRRLVDRWRGAIACGVAEAALEALETGMDWDGLRALAFAGIGDPDKFFATLRRCGADIARAVPLDDHQPLTEALMKRLAAEAETLGAQMVTTEKDAVRLPAAFRSRVLTLPVRLQPQDWAPLDAMLAAAGVSGFSSGP